ncbi:MAG: hypothetical protein ACYCWE_06680 [Eubacteriales bacterium]
MKYLELGFNSDISPLKGLSKLEELRFYNSMVTDFSPVAHVKVLKTEPFSIPFPIIKDKEKINEESGDSFKETLTGIPKIKDENFEKLIRDKLNKPTGEITSDDMAEITYLQIFNLNLSIFQALNIALT